MLEYMENKDYQKAMEIADTIDWRRVKSSSMLNTVSEIYEYNGEYQKSRDILFVAFDRSPGSRKIVYRLGMLALKINDPEEASDCYEEFVKLAPRDPNQYILKYKILRAQGAPLTEQIAALEEFKKAEYVEKWAYELAERYHEAGMTAECLEECDDLILWFSEGKYVYKAMELKMKYKPLTPLQQEKYDSRPGAAKKAPEEPAEEPVEETVEEAVEETVEAAEVPAEAEEESVETEEAEEESAEEIEEEEAEEEHAEETEEDEAEEEPEKEKHSAITQVVKGATLEEALATGMALASGIHIEKEAMEKKEEDLRATSQMRIDDILQEWEEKQKEHAEAIEEQKAKDEERLQKEREEAMRRQEEERREVERKAAEAEAARKAAEEEAARKAAEEEAARKAAEEEAARKAAEEEAARKAAEEAEKEELLENAFAEGKTQRIPDDLVRLVAEMEQGSEDEAEEEEELEEADFDDFDFEDDFEEEFEDEASEEDFDEEDFDEEDFEEEDFDEEELEEDSDVDDFEEDDFEEDFDEEDFDEEDFDEEDFDEEDFDEEDFDEEDFDEEDFDEEDFDEEDFDEEDFDEEDFDEEDFEEEDFDEEEPEEEFDVEALEIEEPSEEEIQERIKKSKGSGVPFDTGFVVTGRYDLSATSEIGLKAGLTEEQKKLFSYFVPVRGMSEQIVEVLDNDRRAQREGTSKTGNLLVVGRKGSGKTVLAVDIVKAIQKQRNLKQGKVAIVTGESLNKKELTNIIQKLRGGAIIIEKAGKLNSRTIKELNYLMEKKTGELLFVLEDQRKPLERMLAISPEFKKKFTSKLELPVFINDELVTFGQTYAKENGYKLDEMGILALYSRIDVMQREDHAVSVAEVKEIMDEAIDHSQKANVKHLARRVFKKGTDDSDRIILKEEDFKI
ncbi:hypothetical protein H6A13_10585 [Mordavella massiliensis]|uniref:CbbX protein n=2 Tax=Mordavella massiliensis TaxID=1871024 RepID=A0A938X4S7_9CLOT|nr:hypothetical protein [Mordavella massiliensis]MBM6827534.1 hypothetical protein [Mordavella massiliensis]